MPRSLVLINERDKVYNLIAKTRSTDKFSVVKSFAKGVLTEIRELKLHNSQECVVESKLAAKKRVETALMGCRTIMVTDKEGNLIPSSRLDSMQGEKFREVWSFNKKMPIYQLVVEQGRPWDDEEVVAALKWWVEAAILHLSYSDRLDVALECAAYTTEVEQEAELAAANPTDGASDGAANGETDGAAEAVA